MEEQGGWPGQGGLLIPYTFTAWKELVFHEKKESKKKKRKEANDKK